MHLVKSEQSSNQLTFDHAVLIVLAHQKSAHKATKSGSLCPNINDLLPLSNIENISNFPTLLTVSEECNFNDLPKELLQMHPGSEIVSCFNRVNAWYDFNFKAAMEKFAARELIKVGQQLIVAGVLQDICFLFTAISAARAGYKVYALIEPSSDWNSPILRAAMSRMIQVGCQMINYATLSAVLQPQKQRTNFMNLPKQEVILTAT